MKTLLSKVFFLLALIVLPLKALPATAQSALTFEITDGKSNRSLLQMSSAKEANADGLSVQQNHTPAQANRPESWNFTIKNSSSAARWLYLRWEAGWDSAVDVNQLRYWSGKGEPVTGTSLLQTPLATAALNTSMLQAIYDSKSGLALALPPDEIVSQFEQSLRSTPGNGLRLRLQIPLVLDGGQSDTFPIEVYRFTPRYGFRDALAQYYAAHPAAFKPRTDIDPRAGGVSGSRPWLALATGDPVRAFEETRRYGGDWEWFYAQFRRTGDIYVRDQFWDYKPARPFNAYRNLASAQVFRDTRKKNLESIDATGAAAAFYVPAFLYAEEQLAQQEYSDAIIRKPDGSFARHYTTPWVTYSDNEILMYPWGNKFAEQSMEDARQLVAENNVPAFGYDIMAGGTPFRGEGMKKSPRRAFDADGEYVDSAVGIAKMADFTRSLENNGHKVGLVGNATNESRPFLVARSDTLMFEQPPYYYAEELNALRYAAGHKVMTFWIGWKLPDLLKWEEMTPEQLRDAYQGAADYTRLCAYRYGGYPSASWRGSAAITRMSAQLKEVILQGWQAVPAVRAAGGDFPAHIWPARYGSDLGSFITIGNAEKTAWNGQVVIDNDYLGNSNYLFCGADGKLLSQTVRGRSTILQIAIPARETLVLRAVAAVPASASGAATVGWKDDGASGDLNIASALEAARVVAPRNGWGTPVRSGQNWNFKSSYFTSPANEIRAFPFFEGPATAQIVIPETASAEEEWAAQRVKEYFQFWGKEGMQPVREIVLPIIHGEKNADAAKPKIVIGGESKTIRRDGNTLAIGGRSLREATLQFLSALDEKYFYTGVMPTTGREAEALKKAGLAGKTLE